MNQKRKARFRMAQATAAILRRNQSTWESLSAFAEAVGDLTDLIGQIEAAEQAQTRRTQIATAEKEQALAELAQLAEEIAGAVHAYAVVQADQELIQALDVRRGQYLNPRQDNVVTRCQVVVETATERLEKLSDYGVTSAKVGQLKKRLQAYQEAASRPREAVAAKNAANTRLRGLFAELDTVLGDRLDRLVTQFRGTNPGFCEEYGEARWLVYATRSRARRADLASTAEVQANAPTTDDTTLGDRRITPLVVDPATQTKAA